MFVFFYLVFIITLKSDKEIFKRGCPKVNNFFLSDIEKPHFTFKGWCISDKNSPSDQTPELKPRQADRDRSSA